MRLELSHHISNDVDEKKSFFNHLPFKFRDIFLSDDLISAILSEEFADTDELCGLCDVALKYGFMNLRIDDMIVSETYIKYALEQFPDLKLSYNLVNSIEKHSRPILWFGVPLETPYELSGSTSVGCATLVNLAASIEAPICGLSPSKFPNSLMFDFLEFVSNISRPIGLIGGDHRVVAHFLKPVKSKLNGQKIAYVHIDAHHDLYGWESGKLYNLPSTVCSDLMKEDITEHIFMIGLRDSRTDLSAAISSGKNIHIGMQNTAREIFDSCYVHLSIDVDVLDPSLCRAVTNPLPRGFSLEKLFLEIDAVFNFVTPNSFSICEYSGSDLESAKKISEIFTHVIEKN